MSSLSIVTFILWSTGLSTFALFGLALSDWRTERREQRMTLAKFSNHGSVEKLIPAAKPQPAAAVQVESMQLAKAA